MPTVCIKIGGSTTDTPGFLEDLGDGIKAVFDSHFVVLVHGGGKDIGRQLGLLNKEFSFVEGMRVTDNETMRHVQMVLSGDVNKRIVNTLLGRGVAALGVSGVDMGLIEARKMTVNGRDIGQVGEVVRVDCRLLDIAKGNRVVPVVSPVSRGNDGQFYNVNADLAAAEIACALSADHLIYISDVRGVMSGEDVLREIRLDSVRDLVAEEIVTGGMVPKLRSAAEAVTRGVGRVHICGWHGTDTIAQELAVRTSQGTVVY